MSEQNLSMPDHPVSEKSDPPHAVVLLDSPTVLEAGSPCCSSLTQDSLGDLNRGWSFAIANSSTLLYGFYALGDIAPIRTTPGLRAAALLPSALGSLSFLTAVVFRARSAICRRMGRSEKFVADVKKLKSQNICHMLGPEMLLIGLALIPIFAEIMALIWVPYSPRTAAQNLADWMPLEHGFIGFVAGLAAVYCAYMYRVVSRLG